MNTLSALFTQNKRRIGIFIPDVVIKEKHTDTLEITEHPVERPTGNGAGFVTDHAFRRPSEVVIDVGFSGGGSLLDFANTSALGLSRGISPNDTYQSLLDLQRSRTPFNVITGKRSYSNMLIRSLDVTTERPTENVLMATLTLRELIISSTNQKQVASKEDMTQGVSTSAVTNTGNKALVSPINSPLKSRNSATGGTAA